MNQQHPVPLTPSWYGDSVGHYEDDTLVIDTVGTRPDRKYAMVDLFDTPFTARLHVVERYRLIDFEEAKEGLARDAKQHPGFLRHLVAPVPSRYGAARIGARPGHQPGAAQG